MMDPVVLGELVDRYGAALVLYARQWCHTPEDVVQEAFLKFAKQATVPDPLLPWLFKVVRNGAISAFRSAQRRRKHEEQAAQLTQSWFLPAEDPNLDIQAVTQSLRGLPDEQREIITLHLWGGLTFEQIAKVMDSTSSTVHRWYLAGLANLKERLQRHVQSTS